MLLESERLRIRNWLDGDADAFYLLNSDTEVMRYFPSVLGRRESDDFCEK